MRLCMCLWISRAILKQIMKPHAADIDAATWWHSLCNKVLLCNASWGWDEPNRKVVIWRSGELEEGLRPYTNATCVFLTLCHLISSTFDTVFDVVQLIGARFVKGISYLLLNMTILLMCLNTSEYFVNCPSFLASDVNIGCYGLPLFRRKEATS